MTKLSDMVAYRAHLRELRSGLQEPHVHQLLAPALHMISHNEIQFPKLTRDLTQRYQALEQDFVLFRDTYDAVLTRLQSDIDELEKVYLTQSYELYDQGMVHDTVDHILGRRFSLSEDSEQIILGRLRLQTDWHRSGLIIRPGLESWIDHMVDCDPLYLVDHDHALLAPSMERFKDPYRRRLRPYIVTDSADSDMMAALPDQQMGLVLAYNFFHYKPLEIIKAYLKEIFQKLLPGGVLAMTFNDCDQPGAVELTERFYMCYATHGMIATLAESIGYEHHFRCEISAATTWLELRRPGSKPSLKGGQALAKIMHRHRRRK